MLCRVTSQAQDSRSQQEDHLGLDAVPKCMDDVLSGTHGHELVHRTFK